MKTKIHIALFGLLAVFLFTVCPIESAPSPPPPTELWFRFNNSTNFNAKFGRLTIQAAYLDFSITYLVEVYNGQTNIVGKFPVHVTGPDMKAIATSPAPYATLKTILLSNTNFVELKLTEKP